MGGQEQRGERETVLTVLECQGPVIPEGSAFAMFWSLILLRFYDYVLFFLPQRVESKYIQVAAVILLY